MKRRDLAWTIYDHLNMNRATRYTATDEAA